MATVYEKVKSKIMNGSLIPDGFDFTILNKIPDDVWKEFIDDLLSYAYRKKFDTLEYWGKIFNYDFADHTIYNFRVNRNKDSYTFKIIIPQAWTNHKEIPLWIPLVFDIKQTKKFSDPQNEFELESSITVTPIVRTHYTEIKQVMEEWKDLD